MHELVKSQLFVSTRGNSMTDKVSPTQIRRENKPFSMARTVTRSTILCRTSGGGKRGVEVVQIKRKSVKT